MKKSKKMIILVSVIAFLFLIGVVSLLFLKYNNSDKDTDFKINYSNNLYEYEINLHKNDVNVTVSEQVFCIKSPCDPIPIEEFNLNFSNSNMKIVTEFINKYRKNDSNSITLHESELSDKDKSILNAIIYNDESYLK